jgi:phage FluMu gp28-like protein
LEEYRRQLNKAVQEGESVRQNLSSVQSVLLDDKTKEGYLHQIQELNRKLRASYEDIIMERHGAEERVRELLATLR